MPVRMTRRTASLYGIRTKPRKPSPRERWNGYASGLEQQYAERLSRDPTVKKWVYEPWQWILVPGPKPVRYTPDFLVIKHTSPKWEIHETKGLWRPKDRVIMKLCADKWGHEFLIYGITQVHGLWDFETFGKW